MSVYIVTYDLHKGATPFDYERLVTLIKEEGSWLVSVALRIW